LALENALRQWRGLGLGLVLLSEHAGRFDYRCRENIDSWIVGKVTDAKALPKLAPVFGSAGESLLKRLPEFGPSEFAMVRSDALARFQAGNHGAASQVPASQ
jgi:hypothetical protein